MELRVGLGCDSHRLASGGPLRLGGVDLPAELHLVGHSDADALLHAVTDALLGAAGLDDIGQWFPNSDHRYAGADSGDLLQRAWELVQQRGWRLVNLDCVVWAEQPKLAPHKLAMRQRLAALLQVDSERIGIKGKTGEGVGPVGRGEAIQTQCVALLMRAESPGSAASSVGL
jgi:2-C-methyl-D-erythritol 2,4-cyclodiphosphate synthase